MLDVKKLLTKVLKRQYPTLLLALLLLGTAVFKDYKMIPFTIGLIIGLLFGTALTCCVVAGGKK